jgi:hypothetical protein
MKTSLYFWPVLVWPVLAWLVLPVLCLPVLGQSPPQSIDFEQHIRPLLAEHCFECHSEKSKPLQGGLRLDSPNHILAGGDSGPSLAAAKPDESLLIQAVRYKDPSTAMPPGGKLSDELIGKLELWVRSGASMPTDEQTAKVQRSIDIQAGRVHWSFVPTQPLAVDSIRLQRLQGESELVNNRIDVAILKKLDELELTPAPQADRRALVRRLKLDLLGLLPSDEEVSGFVQDPSPEAYMRLVDEYLASPQYGERWARYWLDLVRYCDTMEEWTETIGPSYPYRDWVVEALNKDLPYDQFIHLQLAADQMPGALASDRAALGFLGLSPSYWKELQLPVEIIKSIVSDEVEERVHTVSSTFLGLNLACARCHDHKYDPLTHSDYYAIAGVLANTKSTDVALTQGVDAAEVVQSRKTVKTLNAELEKITKSDKDEDKVKAEDIRQKIDQAKAVVGYDALLTPGVKDARLTVLPADGVHGSKIVYEQELKDLSIEIRGNPNKLGQSVPRRFVSVLTDPSSATQAWNSGSGRYDLARSLTSQSRDLVARVMVNRIWKHHFGSGFVDTPSDFGRQGDAPTHRELLDDLAYRFIEQGWSIKWLQREILLSAAYQRQHASASQADPELRYHSAFPRRPLDVEAWRDSLLQVTEGLSLRVGGPSQDLNDSSNARRTIYGHIKRREITDLLRLFDFPDPLTHSPMRISTITPLQQLYVLNSRFVIERAEALVARLEREGIGDTNERIRLLYRWLYQRDPTDREFAKVVSFVKDSRESWQLLAQTLLASNEFYFWN